MSKELTPQQKARITVLSKKSTDELINLILTKDKQQRNCDEKIIEFKKIITENNSTIESKDRTIVELRDKCNDTYDRLKTKQEQNDNLEATNKQLESDIDKLSSEVTRLKNLCNFRRKVIFTCFGIIGILITLLIVLSLI